MNAPHSTRNTKTARAESWLTLILLTGAVVMLVVVGYLLNGLWAEAQGVIDTINNGTPTAPAGCIGGAS